MSGGANRQSRQRSGVRLIVAEKPSVARDIARVVGARQRRQGFLEGDGVRVSWCIGHLAELCEPHEYDARWKSWSPELLPILPERFRVRPTGSGAAQMRVLRRLMSATDLGMVINACDAGREGELIFRRVQELAGRSPPVSRLWISSLTPAAIRAGLDRLRPASDFDGLADAAASRAEADWLVGMNATRALTALARKGRPKGQRRGADSLMSVGRVQTPTLAMITRREDRIEAFEKRPYWQVEAQFSTPPGAARPARYVGWWHDARAAAESRRPRNGAQSGPDASTERPTPDRIERQEDARAIADAVAGRPGHITRVEQKTVRERPPLLFDLTNLQKAANRRFGMSAKRTLAAAQALYETHKAITYPRTDSRHLPRDMLGQLPTVARSLQQPPYQPFADQALQRLSEGRPLGKRVIDDAEVGDHHAIIPTDKRPAEGRLGNDETRVLDLITHRFLAVFLDDAVFEKTRVHTQVEEHLFISKGKVCTQVGWHEVEPPARAKRASARRGAKARNESGEDERELPSLRQGAAVHTDRAEVLERETKPPKRYTEATLLAAMEHAGRQVEEAALRRALKERGLGTPATRAAIIETLIKRKYIERKARTLHPTARGRALIAAMPVVELTSPEMTGAWEQKLAHMARGQLPRERFMSEIRSFTNHIVTTIAAANPPTMPDAPPPETLGSCPVCGTAVREGHRAYQCETGKGCAFVIFKRIARRSVSPALVRVLLARGRSQKLRGFRSKKGKRFSAALRLTEVGKVEFDFEDRQDRQDRQDRDTGARTARPSARRLRADAPTPAGDDSPATGDKSRTRKRAPRCPLCRSGRVMAGRRGWGCSRWRESCRFVVWFQQSGIRVPDDEADRLFRRGQTRLMDGLSPEGRARLVLDLDVEGNVRIELSKRVRSRRSGR